MPSASTVSGATTSEPARTSAAARPPAHAPVPGAHADDAPVLDEQLRRGRLRNYGDAERLGLLAEEAPELETERM